MCHETRIHDAAQDAATMMAKAFGRETEPPEPTPDPDPVPEPPQPDPVPEPAYV